MNFHNNIGPILANKQFCEFLLKITINITGLFNIN